MTPRQRMKIRKATRRKDTDPSETESELNIVPFLDIVVNLMLFLLATSAATMVMAETTVESPGYCATGNCDGRQSIQLSVTLTEGGVVIASRNGRLGPGCDDGGGDAGPTVAMRGREYDFESLGSCLAAVHERYPDETSVILSADPMVQYESIIGAMDTIHGSFEDIRLSAGVR